MCPLMLASKAFIGNHESVTITLGCLTPRTHLTVQINYSAFAVNASTLAYLVSLGGLNDKMNLL